ncbi:MAG: DUF2783 domain-containing protein [Rubrivivax sp.]|nr:DUF2783 domain-containing protein [Rubrivivax sp.]
MPLTLTPNIDDPDGFYAELVDAQRGLDDTAAQKMLAKLVLVLANHVGDRAVLSEAIAVARWTTPPDARPRMPPRNGSATAIA